MPCITCIKMCVGYDESVYVMRNHRSELEFLSSFTQAQIPFGSGMNPPLRSYGLNCSTCIWKNDCYMYKFELDSSISDYESLSIAPCEHPHSNKEGTLKAGQKVEQTKSINTIETGYLQVPDYHHLPWKNKSVLSGSQQVCSMHGIASFF